MKSVIILDLSLNKVLLQIAYFAVNLLEFFGQDVDKFTTVNLSTYLGPQGKPQDSIKFPARNLQFSYKTLFRESIVLKVVLFQFNGESYDLWSNA